MMSSQTTCSPRRQVSLDRHTKRPHSKELRPSSRSDWSATISDLRRLAGHPKIIFWILVVYAGKCDGSQAMPEAEAEVAWPKTIKYIVEAGTPAALADLEAAAFADLEAANALVDLQKGKQTSPHDKFFVHWTNAIKYIVEIRSSSALKDLEAAYTLLMLHASLPGKKRKRTSPSKSYKSEDIYIGSVRGAPQILAARAKRHLKKGQIIDRHFSGVLTDIASFYKLYPGQDWADCCYLGNGTIIDAKYHGNETRMIKSCGPMKHFRNVQAIQYKGVIFFECTDDISKGEMLFTDPMEALYGYKEFPYPNETRQSEQSKGAPPAKRRRTNPATSGNRQPKRSRPLPSKPAQSSEPELLSPSDI